MIIRLKQQYETLEDLKYIKHNEIDVEYYEAYETRYGKMIYERIYSFDDVIWKKSIAKMKSNNFELCNIFSIICDINNKVIYVLFNERITQSIIQRKAVAARIYCSNNFKWVDAR